MIPEQHQQLFKELVEGPELDELYTLLVRMSKFKVLDEYPLEEYEQIMPKEHKRLETKLEQIEPLIRDLVHE